MFDYFEGELTPHEMVEVENFVLNNPEYHADFKAWEESYTVVDKRKPVAQFNAASVMKDVTLLDYNWFKLAAATLAILFTVGGSYLYVNNKISDDALSYDTSLGRLRISSFDKIDEVLFYNKLIRLSELAKANESVSNSADIANSDLYEKLSVVDEVDFSKVELSHTKGMDVEFVTGGLAIIGLNSHVENDNLNSENLHLETETLYSAKIVHEVSKLRKANKQYSFLNFKSNGYRGIEYKKLRDRRKNEKKSKENVPTIAQGELGQKNKQKEKTSFKKLLDNFKYLELAFDNLNDPIFVVRNGMPLAQNPAMSGQLGFSRIKNSSGVNLTNNNSIGGMYSHSSYDTYLKPLKAGVGLLHKTEFSTDHNYQSLALTYAQKFQINKSSFLQIGLTSSMEKLELKKENSLHEIAFSNGATFTSDELALVHNTEWNYNLGLSTWFSGKHFYGGFSVTNLLNNSLLHLQETGVNYFNNISISAQLGADYKKDVISTTVISPQILYIKDFRYHAVSAGATIKYKSLIAGASLSSNVEGRALLGLQSANFRITYSYGTQSDFINLLSQQHQVSIRILMGNTNSNLLRYEM